MPTYSALTTLPDAAAATALGEALEALTPAPDGVGVFEMEDGSNLWEVGGYFTTPPDDTALALLAAAYGARPFVVSELPEIDWVAKVRRDLSPVEAGRFWVYGSHDADRLPEDRIGLLIEAAMAFGTGHHGTTQGCLMALDALDRAGLRPQRIADIGCGTAVLAMGAARLWPVTVLAGDIDAVAVEVAQANVTANGLDGRVVVVEATGFEHPQLTDRAPYDLVFANILKGPLIELAPAMARHIGAGGHAILSGLLNEQAEAVLERYDAAGFTCTDQITRGDWTTLTLQRTP